ncbi:MAG: site-2 protease family protein [Phycisphaerales bacterium]
MLDRWWVAEWWAADPAMLISWIVWIIGSVCLHELGHGWAAIRCGDRTPIELGHMTWNPLVHMGPISLGVFALTGITWGLMPVNPARFRGPYDFAKVALAGPVMNLSLAITALLLSGCWIGMAGGYWFNGVSVSATLYGNVQTFFWVGVAVNLFGAAFNLLPIPPLDGSTIARTLSPAYRELVSREQAPLFSAIAFAVVFVWGSQHIYDAVFGTATAVVDYVATAMTGRTR